MPTIPFADRFKQGIAALEGNYAFDFNSDVYKTIALFVDSLCSSVGVFLATALADTGLAIASVVVISFFGLLLLILTVTTLILFAVVRKKRRGRWIFISADCVIILGTFLYFVGDNLPVALSSYNSELSLTQTSVDDAETSGKALIFIALICFRLVPPLLRKWVQVVGVKPDEITNHKLLSAAFILHMLALMLEFDAIFTVAWGISFTPYSTCTTSDLYGSWVSWGILWLIWIGFVLLYFFLSSTNLKGANCMLCDSKLSASLMTIAIPLLCVGLGALLLGDNDEPLGCICNSGTTTECTELTGNRIRAGLMGGTIISLLSSVTIVVIFFVRSK